MPNQKRFLTVVVSLPILLIGIHVFGPLAAEDGSAARDCREGEERGERGRGKRASNETNCSLI